MSESTKPINNKQQQGDAFERPVARIFDLYLSGAIESAERYQDWKQHYVPNLSFEVYILN